MNTKKIKLLRKEKMKKTELVIKKSESQLFCKKFFYFLSLFPFIIYIKFYLIFIRYPSTEEYEEIFELEELEGTMFFIICYESELENKLYIWKGANVNLEDNEYNEFIEDVKMNFFAKEIIDKDLIKIIKEIPYSESDDFFEFFM
jgi:hypothetical protein